MCHPFNHRGWFNFGAGALGDMGCHQANTFYKVLGLGHPTMISATCTRMSDVAFPLASVVTFDPEAFRVSGNDAADALLRRKYHDGWSLKAHA